MRRCPVPVLVLALILAAPAALTDEPHAIRKATLRASPSAGATLGEIAADAPVVELERSGDWVRVRVEGWIPLTALTGSGGSAPNAAAVGAPIVAATAPLVAAAGPASIEGTLEIKQAGWLRKKKLTGAGRQVWLLAAGFDLEAAGKMTAEEQASLAALDADAERLTNEADKALRGGSFTDATRRHDELERERDKVLARRVGVLATHHGRREAAAREAAIATATCDARGFFVFPSIAAGSYGLYARMVERDLDLEWVETIVVGTTGTRIGLDETRARGLPQSSRK